MIRFNCPSCNKLYSFSMLPVPDSGAEFLCARCNSKCLLIRKNDNVTVSLIAAENTEDDSLSQQVYDSYRPKEEESYSPEELERRMRGLITELPVGVDYMIGVMEGPDQGMMTAIETPTIVIGKTGCDINLSDTNVSREHCKIEVFGRQLMVLRDLDSTWGTFKNGEQITLATLSPGDKIQVGKTTLSMLQTERKT